MSAQGPESDPPATRKPLTVDRHLGLLRHKALMLAMESKHGEAGQLLLEGLALDGREFAQLTAEERRLFNMAAAYFTKAGDNERAALVFERLGEQQRAALSRSIPAATRRRSGSPDSAPPTGTSQVPLLIERALEPPSMAPNSSRASGAAQVRAEARQLLLADKKLEAAELLASAKLHYEAALCFTKAGEGSRALSHLMLVAPGDAQYAVAAKMALRFLTKMGRCTSTLVEYLRPSMALGPEAVEDIPLFRSWSELLIWRGYLSEARATLEAILAKFPNDADSLAVRAHLDKSAGSATIYATDDTRAPMAFSDLAAPPSSPFTERSPQHDLPPKLLNPEQAVATAHAHFSQREPSSSVRLSMIPAPGTPDRVVLRPGVVVGERFKLQAEIGRGGMATVWSALDQELDEEVAVKVFSGDLVTQDHLDDAVARFREELKLCRKLNHPNIIQVYDIGIHGGHRYFTMELLRGRTLEDIMVGPLEPEWALSVVIQACKGLSVAHARGVIHRDIKPANLFVTEEGVLKVMDFGIAKSDEKRNKTQLGTMAGTPAYMPPEQIMGFSTVGPAADQYSLGIVAYEMLTGKLPFFHEEMVPLLMMHREQTPEPLSLHVPNILPELNTAILKMIAKDPAARFKTCEHAATTLSSFFHRETP